MQEEEPTMVRAVPEHKVGIKGSSMDVVGKDPEVHHRHYRCLACLGVTAAAVTALSVVVGVLVVTVFKPRDPRIKLESVILQSWQVELLPPEGLLPSANVSMEITVAVKNPNHASFKYGPSTTRFLYRGSEVGEAPFPGSELAPDRTEIHTSLAVVQLDRVLANPFLLYDLASGEFPLASDTMVTGRVNVFNIYKHRAHARAHCDMVVFAVNQTVGAMVCDYAVRLD